MKTNILNTMKQFAKYICAVVVLLGMSVNVWGTASVSTSITSKTINVEGTSAKSSFSYTFSSTDLLDYWGQVAYVSTDPTTDDEGDGVYTYKYDIGIGSIGTYYTGETSGTIYVSYDIKSSGTYNFTATVYGYDDEWNMVEADVSVTINVTPSCSTSPTVTAGSYSAVRSTTATVSCSGGISSLGSAGCSISDYGFVIGTATGPAIGGSGVKKHRVGTTYTTTSVGFSKDTTGLSPNTTYYVRPYAINGNGTSYGTETSFTTLQRYTITYNKNDGSGSSATEYKDHGISYTVSSDKYSRSGYTLVKWHTLAAGTGGTDYAKGASYTTDAALSLHAVWGGTISFNNNGGSSSMDAEIVVSGDSYELPSCTFTPPSGKKFKCWAQGAADGTERAVGYSHTVAGDITFYAVWRDEQYTDYKFSCADWSLTGPSGDIVFITSAASKTVRSQEAFHVSGSGLPHSTALTFTTFPVNTKFEFKKADGTIPQTNEFGVVDADVYAFYTPDAGDTSDGLDELTSLTVSVTGEPRTATIDTKRIIGRHLPADFVIAAKNTTTNKWYALPANMAAADNPIPSEIAVDDIDNPTIAYTANSNYYSLYGNDTKQYIQFGMTNNLNDASKPFALWANNSDASTKIGKSSGLAENSQGSNYQWLLTQTNTSITNPQDAKYTISNPNNSNALKAWFAAAGGPKWGLYASGVEELRLIPASDIVFTEAYFVEWAQHGGVIEVDAQGIDATSVTAHLGANSATTTLSQTLTSGKSRASKYNYTVNFGNDIDFAAAASNGAMLTLEWKKDETTKAVSNIVVPKIIASSATMSSINSGDDPWLQMEVHVLPGVTLTANAGDFSSNDVVINQLEIYPGATVKVTKGEAASGTLKVKTLVLRNGWTRAGAKAYDVARLYITPSTASLDKNAVSDVWYSDWYIDYDQYYPVAVPWDVTVANFTYRYCTVEPTVGPSANIRLKYYDGESRATNVQEGVGSGANWKTYGATGCTAVPGTLEPSKGYAMTAKRPTGKAFSIIRMPLTIPNASWTTAGEQGEVGGTHKDQVSVTAWGTGSTPEYAKGWNLIANPYMALHQGAITYTEGVELVKYVNIPDVDFKEYSQLATATAELKPASAFLIQAPATGTITFGTTNRKPSAPSFRVEENPASIPEQQAYIVLNNEQSEDMMGILVSDKYTADYEINADLEKLLGDGNTLRTYMRYGDMNMAYVAINEMLAKEWIPVTVRIPADGEYTFSLHEASIAGELEGVYLIDYQNGDKVTNLIEQSYTFSSTAGTINGRFAINAKAGERQTPTGIDAINAGGDINSDKPFKFIYHDKVYIWINGIIYDTTGKRVK